VLQGSVFGPLLFLLLSSDFFQGVNFVLYVDDTNIFVVDKEEELLQHKIEFLTQQLEFWFHKNLFVRNICQTQQLL
jgi:hypothetical protein